MAPPLPRLSSARWPRRSSRPQPPARPQFDGINKDGKAIELTLPGKQKWPISANKDGKIDKYEHVKVCMMPQIMDEKRIDDKHLDLEEKLYGAALMGLPCNKVDPLNFYLVD